MRRFDDYRRGVETGTMKSATPNVVRDLLDEIDRLRAIVDRLPKDEAGEPIAPGDVLYDGYKAGVVKVTGFDTRDGKLTCLIYRNGWDAICSGYYHDREAAEKART